MDSTMTGMHRELELLRIEVKALRAENEVLRRLSDKGDEWFAAFKADIALYHDAQSESYLKFAKERLYSKIVSLFGGAGLMEELFHRDDYDIDFD